MTTTPDNKDLVRQVVTALNEEDRDAFEAVVAADVVGHVGRDDLHGIEAAWEEAFFEAFPDHEYTIDFLVGEDDMVAVRYTATGTHEGAFRGAAPTGTAVEFSAILVFRIDDGTVVEVWGEWDQFGLFRQLGVIDSTLG